MNATRINLSRNSSLTALRRSNQNTEVLWSFHELPAQYTTQTFGAQFGCIAAQHAWFTVSSVHDVFKNGGVVSCRRIDAQIRLCAMSSTGDRPVPHRFHDLHAGDQVIFGQSVLLISSGLTCCGYGAKPKTPIRIDFSFMTGGHKLLLIMVKMFRFASLCLVA